MLKPEGENKQVTIVGAGLVGSLLACFLARRGFEVEVLERRPDMRREKISAGRSINLAISARGIHALGRIGLEREALSQAVPMRGRMMHSPEGSLSFQAYGKDDTQCIHSISRGTLNCLLMTEAEKTGRVRIRFQQRLLSADLSGRPHLRLRDERTGEESSLETGRVFGTDGSASALRAAIARTSSEDALDYGYKELTLPAGPGSRHQLETGHLHIWPRGSFMLIALPNFDGSFTCTLFLPFKGATSFEKLRSGAEAREFFQAHFADALALLPDLAQQWDEHPTGHMVTVRSAPWSLGDKALCLGDAAHAIVPFFGQGMNAGFEDCEILDGMLDQARSWEEAFSSFFERRKPDADAIAELALENFVEMRDKVGNPRFLLEKQVEKRLHELMPEQYVPRYTLVTFSRVPYRLALEAGLIQNRLLSTLCQGVDKAESIDPARARALVSSELGPLMNRIHKETQTWT